MELNQIALVVAFGAVRSVFLFSLPRAIQEM
jgi:hypothetical protein